MNNVIDLKEIFDWNYLTLTPGYTFKYDKLVIFTIVVSFLISIALYILSRKKITEIGINRRIFRYSATFLFLTDLYGLLVYFSRSQLLPIFSLRLMMLAWAGLLALGFLILVLYLIFKYRKDMEVYYKELERRKYLPKKNK